MGLRLRNSKGLSLLELLVAIGILSTGVIVVIQAISFSARAAGVSSDTVKAVLVAYDVIQQLEYAQKSKGISGEDLTGQGEMEKFRWAYTISRVADLNVSALFFETNWTRANRNESIAVRTYLR